MELLNGELLSPASNKRQTLCMPTMCSTVVQQRVSLCPALPLTFFFHDEISSQETECLLTACQDKIGCAHIYVQKQSAMTRGAQNQHAEGASQFEHNHFSSGHTRARIQGMTNLLLTPGC
jgi:hypothetical protein